MMSGPIRKKLKSLQGLSCVYSSAAHLLWPVKLRAVLPSFAEKILVLDEGFRFGLLQEPTVKIGRTKQLSPILLDFSFGPICPHEGRWDEIGTAD
jgi:hypothetical protein